MRATWARPLACLGAAVVAVVLATPGAPVPSSAASTTAPATTSGAVRTPPPPPAAATGRDLSMELRDLFVARDELGLFQRFYASARLARPVHGAADPGGDGYRRASVRRCGTHVCVHRVRKGPDAATGRWASSTLRVMERVWTHETRTLGFRPPPPDRRRGGDHRFDVYLTDLGDRGVFGYCTPERRVRGERFAASGYCVLDNDFARRQYDAPPRRSLKVSAAHEFFHAIQFGYDVREDPWLLESTATWVEESFADAANDNRRYLRYGSVRRPWVPWDTYSNSGYAHYGNWALWEFLEQRYGAGVVRAVWRRASARSGAPDDSSVEALRAVLDRRSGTTGTLRTALAHYAAANLDPARSYPEGASWPAARRSRSVTVERADGSGARTLRVDHLSARHVALRPVTGPADRALRRTRGWRLRLSLQGPRRSAFVVTVRRVDGTRHRRLITDRRSERVVGFDGARVAEVVVTAVNASARYRCGRVTLWACGGRPLDDGRRFEVRFSVER